jgi:hypothetical protein
MRINHKQLAKAKARKAKSRNRGKESPADILREKIRLLKSLPNNYKDSEIGSQQWQDFSFCSTLAKQKEMQDWAKGPILILEPLTPKEAGVFEPRQLVMHPTTERAAVHWIFADFLYITNYAAKFKVSHIYVPQLAKGIVHGLNLLASMHDDSFRWQGKLIFERTQ